MGILSDIERARRGIRGSAWRDCQGGKVQEVNDHGPFVFYEAPHNPEYPKGALYCVREGRLFRTVGDGSKAMRSCALADPSASRPPRS